MQIILQYKEWRKFFGALEKANETNYEVGKKVKKTIEEFGGTMPEDMPTPKKSLKETKRGNKKIVSM